LLLVVLGLVSILTPTQEGSSSHVSSAFAAAKSFGIQVGNYFSYHEILCEKNFGKNGNFLFFMDYHILRGRRLPAANNAIMRLCGICCLAKDKTIRCQKF